MFGAAISHVFTMFGADCSTSFFGFPTWYKYLKLDDKCQVASFTIPGDFLLVALAVIDILLTLAGIVAVGYVIYGGIRYVTSQGNPDQIAKAQSTVLNALIGLLLAVIAISVVSYIGRHV